MTLIYLDVIPFLSIRNPISINQTPSLKTPHNRNIIICRFISNVKLINPYITWVTVWHLKYELNYYLIYQLLE
jgi:hypothetical protein